MKTSMRLRLRTMTMTMTTTTIIALTAAAVVMAGGVARAQAVAGAPGIQGNVITQSMLDSARAANGDVRKQTVAANMMLSPAQAKAFWPVYTAYRAEIDKIRLQQFNALHELVSSGDSLTNAKMNAVLNMWLSTQMQELKVRDRYFPKFSAVLPAKLVARYFQIEHRLDLLVKLAIAEEIPLVH